MTKEQLLARKALLQQETAQQQDIQRQAAEAHANARNQINALGGAIQDCDFWLAELEKESQGLTLVPERQSMDALIEQCLGEEKQA